MGNRARHNARGLVRVTSGEMGDFTSVGANILVITYRARSEGFAPGIQQGDLEGFQVNTPVMLAFLD
jgi:hypothetical protein